MASNENVGASAVVESDMAGKRATIRAGPVVESDDRAEDIAGVDDAGDLVGHEYLVAANWERVAVPFGMIESSGADDRIDWALDYSSVSAATCPVIDSIVVAKQTHVAAAKTLHLVQRVAWVSLVDVD